jgi:transcriptional regulator with XRE-family HTH domain
LDKKSFGHRLKVIMADRDVSATELAQSAGISRQMVNAYLYSGAIPNLKTAADIARALGVTVDELAVTPLIDVIR